MQTNTNGPRHLNQVSKTEMKAIRSSGVLLFSGGLDSVALSLLLHPFKHVYVDFGFAYQKGEMAFAVDRATELGADMQVLDMTGYGKAFPSQPYLLPMRNIVLAVAAGALGSPVLLGGTASDRGSDKDAKFLDKLNALLLYVTANPRLSGLGGVVQCWSPAETMLKSDLLASAILSVAGGSYHYDLLVSVVRESPFCDRSLDGAKRPCGACFNCLVRFSTLEQTVASLADTVFMYVLEPFREATEEMYEALVRANTLNDQGLLSEEARKVLHGDSWDENLGSVFESCQRHTMRKQK